jgi:gluconokinase
MMCRVSHSNAKQDQSMKQPFALALDIGTSSVRAALYDERGDEIEGTAVQHVRSLDTTAGGGAELDANDAIEQVERVVDAALARSSNQARIEIVSVSCFWHSLVGVDRDGQTITPVYGWADTRAAQAVAELRQLFNERETHARTGCRFHASYWPARLVWLRSEQSQVYRSAARWLSFSDLLMLRFFNDATTSVSIASGTGLFNQRLCSWDKEMMARLSFSDENFPQIAGQGKTFNSLLSAYAQRWPQLKDARWYPATGDGAANNIGAGCVTPERAALMIGTSGALRVLSKGDVPDKIPQELWCYRADHRHVITGGALSDGGGLYHWMKGSLKLEGDDEEIESALEAMEPDAHGLTVLPFWAGERSTGWHAQARGTILGLSAHTSSLEILRAAMEAVAYRFALIAEALDQIAPQANIIASGGALRASRVWTQTIADVLGRKLTLSGVREASRRGAVLLALEADGKIQTIADAPTLIEQVFEPDLTRHARYREGLNRQQKLYQRLVIETLT